MNKLYCFIKRKLNSYNIVRITIYRFEMVNIFILCISPSSCNAVTVLPQTPLSHWQFSLCLQCCSFFIFYLKLPTLTLETSSLEAIYQISHSYIWSHKSLYTTFYTYEVLGYSPKPVNRLWCVKSHKVPLLTEISQITRIDWNKLLCLINSMLMCFY